MELLIRSQDREELFKYDTLEISPVFHGDNTPFTFSVGYYKYDKRYGEFRHHSVGEYETKERALKVLDEIQEAKLGNYDYSFPSNVKVSNNEDTIVYEMPKE